MANADFNFGWVEKRQGSCEEMADGLHLKNGGQIQKAFVETFNLICFSRPRRNLLLANSAPLLQPTQAVAGIGPQGIGLAGQGGRRVQEARRGSGGDRRVQEPDLARRRGRVLAGKVRRQRSGPVRQDRGAALRAGGRLLVRAPLPVEVVRHDTLQRRQSFRFVIRMFKPTWSIFWPQAKDLTKLSKR